MPEAESPLKICACRHRRVAHRAVLSQADDLDFARPGEQPVIRPGFEISKLLAVIDFALASSADPEDDFLSDLQLTSPEELKKRVNGVFEFQVKSGSEKQVRRSGCGARADLGRPGMRT